MIPIARQGLALQHIHQDDIDKYLGIIEERIKTEQTGARWILGSYNKLSKEGAKDEAIITTTEGIYQRQKTGNPVHTWKLPELKEGGNWINRFWYVRQVMTTDLITIQDDEPVDLLQDIMSWSDISYVPVENSQGDLIGVVSIKQILGILIDQPEINARHLLVRDIMSREFLTVDPGTATIDAIKMMIQREMTVLLVVKGKKLVGIFTQNDYLKIAPALFEEFSKKSKSE